MPRQAKGARLHKFKHRPYWYIRDTGQPDRSTGCTSREEAEKALAAYIATKGREGSANEPANVTCDEVLAIYAEEYAPTVAAPERQAYALDALLPFWGGLKVSHVKGETCRRYAKTRKKVTKRDDTGEPIEWAPIVDVFTTCWAAPIDCVAIENPEMNDLACDRMPDSLPRPHMVQPFWFGEPAYKSTGWYLRGLPQLIETNRLKEPERGSDEWKAWNRIHRMPPGPERARLRSRSFPGMMQAAAAQWGPHAVGQYAERKAA